MNKYINFIKVLWNDERGKALIKLSVYLIFMVFVVLYTRTIVNKAPDKNIISKEEKTSYEKFVSQVDYNANIDIANYKISLIGGEVTSFEHNGIQYTVVNSKLMKNGIEANDFYIYFWKFTPKFIGEILDGREAEFTSNYKDGMVKKGYKISLAEFIEKYNVSIVNTNAVENIPDEYIEIVLEDTGDKIERVTLNLDSYYKFVIGETEKFSIEIKY